MKKHYKIKIIGRVQGVAFRYYTKQKALELGLKGFVSNESDNSVYIEVEGEEVEIKKFLDWSKTGPDLARVEKMDFLESEIKYYTEFIIRC